MTTENTLDFGPLAAQINTILESIEVTEQSSLFIMAALQRSNELAVLLALAQGKPWPFRKELSPLTRDINDYFKAIETRLSAPMADTLTPEQVEAEAQLRDECVERVDAARIVALSMLTHMSAAIEMSKPSTSNLKAV